MAGFVVVVFPRLCFGAAGGNFHLYFGCAWKALKREFIIDHGHGAGLRGFKLLEVDQRHLGIKLADKRAQVFRRARRHVRKYVYKQLIQLIFVFV